MICIYIYIHIHICGAKIITPSYHFKLHAICYHDMYCLFSLHIRKKYHQKYTSNVPNKKYPLFL